MKLSETHILGSPESASIATEISDRLEIRHDIVFQDEFCDGERRDRLNPENIAGKNIIVVGSTYGGDGGGYKRHQNIRTLMFGAEEYGAKSVSAVVPMMGYSTMERAKDGEIPKGILFFRDIINQILGDGKAFFMGLHSENIARGTDPEKWVNIKPYEVLGDIIKTKLEAQNISHDLAVIVSPDAGYRASAKAIADRVGCGVFVAEKERSSKDQTKCLSDLSSLNGKVAIITDDMIRTGGTLKGIIDGSLAAGAIDVIILSPHLLLAGDAREKLVGSSSVVGFNTNYLIPPNFAFSKLGNINPQVELNNISESIRIRNEFNQKLQIYSCIPLFVEQMYKNLNLK